MNLGRAEDNDFVNFHPHCRSMVYLLFTQVSGSSLITLLVYVHDLNWIYTNYVDQVLLKL